MSPHLLSELVFAPNQTSGQEDTIILPLLKSQGIVHAISIGPASQNMSEFHLDTTREEITSRQEKFLAKNNLAPLSHSFISIKPTYTLPHIVDITSPLSTGPTIIEAEGLFTTLSDTPLIHRPADCPTAIIIAKTPNNERVLGIIHLGRPQVNDRVTEAAFEHLLNHYNVSPADIYIGIAPSIGSQYYFIKTNDQQAKQLLDLAYWGKFALEDKESEEKVIRINVLGKILSILEEKGIPPGNIQAYGYANAVDTYALAAKNPLQAFSYRYSVHNNRPDRNGRIMIAAQIS